MTNWKAFSAEKPQKSKGTNKRTIHLDWLVEKCTEKPTTSNKGEFEKKSKNTYWNWSPNSIINGWVLLISGVVLIQILKFKSFDDDFDLKKKEQEEVQSDKTGD